MLISSVLDMVKWDAALDSEGLLKKTSLDQMWTPVRLNDGTTYKYKYNYGFGWYLRPVPGHRTVAHGGGLPGFSTFIWRFIDDKLTVILLSNCETADTGRIALGVAGFYVPALLSPEIKKQLFSHFTRHLRTATTDSDLAAMSFLPVRGRRTSQRTTTLVGTTAADIE